MNQILIQTNKMNYYRKSSNYGSAKKQLILMFIAFALLITVPALNIGMNIILKQNCTGYLERAASANTVETAKEELGIALKYLEDNNLTTGYTSVIYRTPDDDIGYWYKNLKDSYGELDKVTNQTSSLEKTNILMKLRETIMDHGKNGDYVTKPNGLSRYPNNLAWGLLNSFSILILFITVCYIKSN